MSTDKILFYANLIKEKFCLNTDHINKEQAIKDFILRILLQYFPVIELTRGNYSVFIDSVELLLDSLVFEILLTFDDQKEPNNGAAKDNAIDVDSIQTTSKVFGPKEKPGRKLLVEKFPMLVAYATDFIKSNSFAAHNCRRETMGTGAGVSLKDLQKHLIKNIPGLEDHGISQDIHTI